MMSLWYFRFMHYQMYITNMYIYRHNYHISKIYIYAYWYSIIIHKIMIEINHKVNNMNTYDNHDNN
jgi:hypothetical protein